MKYNRAFIAAVQAVAEAAGDVAAEAVFNKLFDVVAAPAAPPFVYKKKADWLEALRSKADFYVYENDIDIVNARIGVPYHGCSFAVAWIKEFRAVAEVGLKNSKDVFDFVRDNKRPAGF
jgi:hypothetical protein